jgi:Leucine-rich repeat (LRR) protein
MHRSNHPSIYRLIHPIHPSTHPLKVGEACICRLARVLAMTPEVERLDLGSNGLEALPDEVFRLRRLRVLDISGASSRDGGGGGGGGHFLVLCAWGFGTPSWAWALR